MLDLYCLTNFTDYSLAIHQPLKHSNRIKYTCFDISDNYIVLGATSGSLYIFNRQGKFLLLVPSKHGAVNLLSISANEKYVAFATQRSVVCVYAVNLSAQAAPQVVFTNLSSDGTLQVSCIHWTQEEKQFYYGDSQGHVNLVLLSTFIGTSLLNMSIHPILFLEQQPIIQIDDYEALLLVSNCFKCLLCNTEYEEYKQIGVKPRFGPFGACFFISPNEAQQPSRIFCARPGSRIWEVDFEGEVLRTHQFKHALACPPTKILKPQDHDTDNDNLSCSDNDGNDEMLDYQPQMLQFRKLQKLTQDFILAHTELGLYIFDVRNSGVVLWCNQFERIVECRAMKHGEIGVFTQTGSLYTMQLQTMQHHACAMIHQNKLLECAWLMRKNVRYFADKAREDCELGILNQIKHFLMGRHQYELLNDLSVIFDAIAQCESNGDNNSSGGSSVTAERSTSLGAAMNTPAHQLYTSHSNNHIQCQTQRQSCAQNGFIAATVTTTVAATATAKATVAATGTATVTGVVDTQLSNMNKVTSNDTDERSVYVLENAFCDNLKPHKGERHFKDALLTVTGKFGKNIIKYKFNIFQEEQQKLVEDLIPAHERSLPFKDVKALYEPDEDIVCRSSSSSNKKSIWVASSSNQSTPNKTLKDTSQHITAEEKTIYNLYLICKSSKFSNMNFVERYRTLFDEYTAPELRRLLDKLSQLMVDHGDDPKQAQRHCYEMYFQYLNPELIWEMDEQSRDYITDGFILLNASDDVVRCDNCLFPLRFNNTCQFHELGSVLLRYYWSRNEQIKCFDVLTRVPALFDVLARLYLAEYNMEKVLPIILNYGQPELLIELGKNLSIASWSRCFEQFVELQQGRLTCVNCEGVTNVENMNRHFFYTWNCFLSILLDYLPAPELLELLYKWSNFIPNDAIDREFYTRCMLKV